jgi:hypothetical protein
MDGLTKRAMQCSVTHELGRLIQPSPEARWDSLNPQGAVRRPERGRANSAGTAQTREPDRSSGSGARLLVLAYVNG